MPPALPHLSVGSEVIRAAVEDGLLAVGEPHLHPGPGLGATEQTQQEKRDQHSGLGESKYRHPGLPKHSGHLTQCKVLKLTGDKKCLHIHWPVSLCKQNIN